MNETWGLLIKGGTIGGLAFLAGTLFVITNSPLPFILILPACFVAISMRSEKHG